MPDDLTPEQIAEAAIQERITKAVEEATSGLKKTNGDLKNEKTSLKEQFDGINAIIEGLGGLEAIKGLGNADTIKQLTEMQKRFMADEQGKLLAEGKYDEWFDRRTTALRKDHDNALKTLQDQLAEANERVGKSDRAYQNKVLETDVSAASLDAGVETTAMMDVRLRAEREFTFDAERNRFVLKDADGGIVFGKDGQTPKSIREWIEDQKETSRHWWPPSKGGGSEGGRRPGDKTALEKLDFRAYQEQRKKDGFKPF